MAGVENVNSAPYHPRCSGSSSGSPHPQRVAQRNQGPAVDLPGLQALLDRFRAHYNLERPHQGIGDLTPAERYQVGSSSFTRTRQRSQRPRRPSTSLTASRADAPHSILRRVSARSGSRRCPSMSAAAGKRPSKSSRSAGSSTSTTATSSYAMSDRTRRIQPLSPRRGRTQPHIHHPTVWTQTLPMNRKEPNKT